MLRRYRQPSAGTRRWFNSTPASSRAERPTTQSSSPAPESCSSTPTPSFSVEPHGSRAPFAFNGCYDDRHDFCDFRHSTPLTSEVLVMAPDNLFGGHHARVAHFRSWSSHRTHDWNPGRRSPRAFADHG